MTLKRRITRAVTSTVIVVVLIMPLSVPAVAHSATYCGHGATTHTHGAFQYRHEFDSHIANFPVHEHKKNHYVNDGGAWVFLHWTSRACSH